MSKIICDICGTSYPESSTQCPICGCVRSAESHVVEESDHEAGGYTYVKGGRFSKSNVRKRNQATASAGEKKPANKKAIGLIIVLVCLILIVSFMIVYILSGWSRQQEQNHNVSPSETTAVACTGLTLSKLEIEMSATGEIWLLEVSAEPVNTTDKFVFTSSDESVVTVSDSGKLTCIGEGQAVITVTCGDQTAECKVNCEFETTTEIPTLPPEGVRLNRKSITADYEGFSWTLYSGPVAMDEIIWTSDDPSIAVIENGVVTALAEGTTTVHAEYNGVTSSCEITCVFEEPTMSGENGDEETSGTEETVADEEDGESRGEYTLYSQYGDPIAYDQYKKAFDVTISVGQTIGMYLKNAAGEKVEPTWTIAEGDSCTVEDNYVTVQSSATNCMLTAEVDGVTYYCYVRTVNG